MKKLIVLLIAAALMLSMCACASIFTAEYYESYPFVEQDGEFEESDRDISNYNMLRSAMLALVEERCEQASFRFGNYDGSLLDDLAAVCVEIKNDDPLGAYAVEDISCDTSRIVSYYTCRISISYKKSAEEIAAIQSVSGLGEFGSHIYNFVADYGGNTVVSVYSSVVNEEYIVELVDSYIKNDPLLAVLEPEVKVGAYPAAGAERIYDITLSYPLDREELLSMDALLTERVAELASTVGPGEKLGQALMLASMLSEMVSLEQESVLYPQTAYGCLVEGDDGARGLAHAYKALCDSLQIGCVTVDGELRSGEVGEHYWNIIEIDGEYYHVDVSRFGAAPASAFLLSDDDIWGNYYWDKGEYPGCRGSLGPEDVFEPVQEEQPTPEPTPDTGPETDEGGGDGAGGDTEMPEEAPDTGGNEE